MSFSPDTYKQDKSKLEEQRAEAEASFDGEQVGKIDQALEDLEKAKAAFEVKSENPGAMTENQERQIVELGGSMEVVNQETTQIDQKIQEIKQETSMQVESLNESEEANTEKSLPENPKAMFDTPNDSLASYEIGTLDHAISKGNLSQKDSFENIKKGNIAERVAVERESVIEQKKVELNNSSLPEKLNEPVTENREAEEQFKVQQQSVRAALDSLQGFKKTGSVGIDDIIDPRNILSSELIDKKDAANLIATVYPEMIQAEADLKKILDANQGSPEDLKKAFSRYITELSEVIGSISNSKVNGRFGFGGIMKDKKDAIKTRVADAYAMIASASESLTEESRFASQKRFGKALEILNK